MNIDQIVSYVKETVSTAMNGYDYKTILYLHKVSESTYNTASVNFKRYRKGEIDKDHEVGTRPRILSDMVFMQPNSVPEIVIGLWNAAKPVEEALAAIKTNWHCLTGMRGQDAIDAAGWIEQQEDKIQVIASEDVDCWDETKNGVFAKIKALGYQKTNCLFHHQSGTYQPGVKVTVSNGVATVECSSVAQVDTITIASVAEGNVYDLGIGSDSISYTADADDTVSDVRTALVTAFNGNGTLSALATLSNHTDADKITATAKTAGTGFTLKSDSSHISMDNVTQNVVAKHNRRAGDKVYLSGSTTATELNGYHLVKEVLQDDQLTFETTATSSDVSGDIAMDAGFMAPEAARVSSLLVYDPGTADWFYHDITGLEPTPDTILDSTLETNLASVNACFFTEMKLSATIDSGMRKVFGGKCASGHFMSDVLINMWYPLEMRRRLVSFIMAQTKTKIETAFLTGLWMKMNEFSQEAYEKLGEFKQNLDMYPETEGYPPGWKPGDRFVNRVPKASSVSTEDRQNYKLTSGIEAHYATPGGLVGFDMIFKQSA